MEIPILIVLIVLSMLFSISESSILGMNKLRLRLLRKNKDKRALKIGRLLDYKERLINTLLVSNEIVNIFVSSIITSLALEAFGQKGVGVATLTATVLLLIFGEITPKNISTRCPDKIAYALSGFISLVSHLLKPLVIVITFISKAILFLFGIRTKKKASYTEAEIRTFFDMSSENGVIEEDENRMMNLVFKFSDLEAQDIMVPRTKIRAVPVTATYRDIIELSQRLGFTRFPVYRKSIDDIVGVIYLKDLLPYKTHIQDFMLQKVMRQPIFILGTKKMSAIQQMLLENRQAMAIVVDEYSGTDGIITQSDIAREIFALPGDDTLRGKVFDYDAVEDKQNFEINGSVLLLDLKEDLHIPLESNINETIGGWFTEQLNRMPEPEDSITFEGWTFTVKKIQAHRIERMMIQQVKDFEGDINLGGAK